MRLEIKEGAIFGWLTRCSILYTVVERSPIISIDLEPELTRIGTPPPRNLLTHKGADFRAKYFLPVSGNPSRSCSFSIVLIESRFQLCRPSSDPATLSGYGLKNLARLELGFDAKQLGGCIEPTAHSQTSRSEQRDRSIVPHAAPCSRLLKTSRHIRGSVTLQPRFSVVRSPH